jgi:hypothetical protein
MTTLFSVRALIKSRSAFKPVRSGAPITLDRPRTLLYDANAYSRIHEATGKNPMTPEFWNGFEENITLQRAALWAGLLHEDETLTLNQAGSFMTMDRLVEIMGAVGEAISASLPPLTNSNAAPANHKPTN